MNYYIFIDHLENEFIISNDGSSIPKNEDNRHYQAYLAWVAEGNTTEEWNPENEAQ